MGVHGLILDSFLVYCLLLVIVILATGAVLLLGALLLMVQWILGIQVDECATAIVRFHHWVWLVLARRQVFSIVVVTSPCCVVVASLTERILIGNVEIATFLSFLIDLRTYFLSLIDEFWGENSLVVKNVCLRSVASHLVIDAGARALPIVFRIFLSQFVEVVVLDGLPCTNSLIRIHLKHLLH
jgi:hypothetical protein